MRIGLAHQGRKKSAESIEKMRQTKLNQNLSGKNNPNYKGVRKTKTCVTCKKKFLAGYHRNVKGAFKYCSRPCKWAYMRTIKGKEHPRYKTGDYAGENKDRRNVTLYIEWRKAVLEKDHYACTLCGRKDQLHCDHIKPWKEHKELRYDVSNGRVLCKFCHYEITFGKSPLNNWEAFSRWAKVTRGKPADYGLLQPQRLSEETGK